MSSAACEVVVVGAGPFGLSLVAHLRATGVDTCIFGEPMAGWRDHMPVNMFVRTPWDANHIADPLGALTLDRYVALSGMQKTFPVPLRDFVRYGLWFQQHVAPDVDRRSVARIQPVDRGFRVLLDDGGSMSARRVVVATGLASFAHRPPEFRHLGPKLASHTSEHSDVTPFAGRRVLIVGAGLSAFEYAEHLKAVGAEVEVVMRARGVRWIDEAQGLRRTSALRRLYRRMRPWLDPVEPPTGVGPPPINWITAAPGAFRRLPRRFRRRINRTIERGIIAHGSSWLVPGLRGVPVTRRRRVTSAVAQNGHVAVRFDDDSERDVDHVMLATGYALDVRRYPFFDRPVLDSIARVDAYPRLRAGFESSIAGLHFVGSIAQGTFGPVMYSVAGTGYTARSITRRIISARARRR